MKTVILALLKLFTGLKRHPKFSAKNEHILYVLDVLGFTFVFFFFFCCGPHWSSILCKIAYKLSLNTLLNMNIMRMLASLF